MSSPQTKIYITQNLGLSNDYRHTFWFDNVAEQTDFFLGKVMKTFVNYTYVRKNWSLKVNASVADAEKWSYLFFQNFPTGRYYYYFITNVKYISDETVELELEMDVMQTYLFDYALQPSFVEREHSATDNIGDNTIEEGLELGEFTCSNIFTPYAFDLLDIMVMSSVVLDGDSYNSANGGKFDGIYSGLAIYRAKNASALNTVLNDLNEAGKTDAIVTIWMYPRDLIETADDSADFSKVKESKVGSSDFSFPVKTTTVDSYVPKNNKLLTYPYNFLYAFNNQGGCAVYRIERFLDQVAEFALDGSIYPDGGVKMTPKNYNGVGFNYDESLNITNFPTCAWNADSYKIWLAQNATSTAVGMSTNVISAVGGGALAIAGLATGNLAIAGVAGGFALSGINGILGQLSQMSDKEVQPPQAQGGFSSTLNTAVGIQRIYLAQKSITRERAKIIDEFFTMYGYKTLRVKTPNRNVRESFTYTKTQGCLLAGSLCQEDARKIQSIYDNGVTFWQKNVAIGNYSASNAVK